MTTTRRLLSPLGLTATITAVAMAALITGGIVADTSSPAESAEPHAVAPLRGATTDQNFYFVMADRFANGDTSNDDGGLGDDPMVSGFDPTQAGFYQGGDLKGLTDRLDYIEGLGTTALWLTPSFTNKAVQVEDNSAGYHGYWITDFTNIDPHLGTNDELTTLVDAAHERGMKVFFDIITNHTADVIGYESNPREAYVSKDERPYTDASGQEFDDRDYSYGGDDAATGFPPLDAQTSFPYVPVLDPGEEDAKTPAWLNDVTLYHNRGNTTFTGEDSQYGDFFGLDDLFTENPVVVDGMIDIYSTWIKDFGIDGFRIDTMRHVDDGFWQRFGPEVLQFAHDQGKEDFFMFGEVFDTSRPYTSSFTTMDRMQAVLDFPFQDAARSYASGGGSAQALADFYAGDDWYTDADSNAYQLPTFLGNHDMGRIGSFIQADNPGIADDEALARDTLSHQLMYLTRGNPVIYYGDEQGFTGEGGDIQSRQPMFATQIDEYVSQDLIGTDVTQAEDTYDTTHPLYATIADLAALTKEHPALRDGVQQNRYADPGAGIYAFSRMDRDEGVEYLVAINNSNEERTASVSTWSPSTDFAGIYGADAVATSGASGEVGVAVPATSAVVYQAAKPIPASADAPGVTISEADSAPEAPGRVRVAAEVDSDAYAEVSFWADAGDGWQYIGTDDNAPFVVYQDVSSLAPGTAVQYAAVVADNAGHTATSEFASAQVPAPEVNITSPEVGATLGSAPVISATVLPDRPGTSVMFQRQVDGGDWEEVGTDASAPVYTVIDDATELQDGADVLYRAIATQDGVEARSLALSTRAGALAQPDEVALPGTVNTAMGCGEDWAPWCDQAQMTLDADAATWSITVDLPAGDYEYKIAIDRAWDENYGVDGVPDGANIPLSLSADSTVTFTYDNETHVVTVEGAS
ncbi:alpha-amylase family glycosyl hydrolase [Demequina aurantiaca]|uniref:alpha-amylase family glycosyl hydrolase n=1 Tax=Demequina aurantiaca TaxID=676200 RepID=UPI000A93F0BE